MKKDLRISELCDVYGELLTVRQREIIKSYYDYDLSLSEISENYGITRQAVRDAIVKGGEQLELYEKSLGVCLIRERFTEAIKEIKKLLELGDVNGAKLLVTKLDSEY